MDDVAILLSFLKRWCGHRPPPSSFQRFQSLSFAFVRLDTTHPLTTGETKRDHHFLTTLPAPATSNLLFTGDIVEV